MVIREGFAGVVYASVTRHLLTVDMVSLFSTIGHPAEGLPCEPSAATGSRWSSDSPREFLHTARPKRQSVTSEGQGPVGAL
jgi:hypothetical protein